MRLRRTLAALRPGTVMTVALASVLLWAASGDLSAWRAHAPLRSNQNTYFLRGLARAHIDRLDADWTASTRDPVPLFSLIVRAGAATWPRASVHLLYLATVTTFVVAAALLGDALVGREGGLGGKIVFLAAVLAPYSRLIGWLPRPLSSLWQAASNGVAGQSVLAGYLQPSEAGVLHVLAITLFALDRPRGAAVSAALACNIHPTYVLPAAFLLVGMCTTLVRECQGRAAAMTAGLWLLLVGPIVVTTLVRFAPTMSSARAAAILARQRLPHHALPGTWVDVRCAVALGVVALAILAWPSRRRLVSCLAVAAAAALTVSLVVAWLDRPALNLLFPWRTSVSIVPVAYALVLAGMIRTVARWCARSPRRWRRWNVGAGAVATALVAMAVVSAGRPSRAYDMSVQVGRNGYDEYRDPRFEDLVGWVRGHSDAGDVYAIPIDPEFVFESFRLRTGQPLVADWKTHPYGDGEVLEWWRRISNTRAIYRELASCGAALDSLLARNGVSRVVVATDLVDVRALQQCVERRPSFLTVQFANARFWVLAVPENPL